MKYSFEWNGTITCNSCPFCVVGKEGESFSCNFLHKENYDACMKKTKRKDCPITEEIVWHPARG